MSVLRRPVARALFVPALVLGTLAVAPQARAAMVVVACDGRGDIADVQAAVDAAADGTTIGLSGTCDFSQAPPHGGGAASVAATAVLVRPGNPVRGLTITSADPASPATILGSGTQAAFTVVAGNDGTRIGGLRFLNLARAVVVAGATRVVVGATGARAPSPAGNTILANATTDSAVLAYANGTAQTLRYGTAGATYSFSPSRLADLTVAANTISYAPPGAPLSNDVVAIDVRQSDGGTVEGVRIEGNAIGMFATEFPSARQNAVRVEALDATPAPSPTPADYAVRDVTVADNVAGVLEQLDLSHSGIDTSRVHAAGRIGVVLVRVGGFRVSGNLVRARLSALGAGAGEPGGGIVVSDTSFGVIARNTVVVVADPSTLTADLGAIGVVDGLRRLGGDDRADQRGSDVEVTDNVVGRLDGGVPTAQRGIVISGPDLVTVHDNRIDTVGGPPLSIGAVVSGGPGGPQLARTVSRSVACRNVLNGTADDPGAVSFTDGDPPSSANNFPGGAGAGVGNAECTPTLTLAPALVVAGDDLVASGRAFAARPVEVILTDELGATRRTTTTAAGDGNWRATFDAATLAGLADGVLTAVATARDPRGFALDSARARVRKDFVVDAPGAGTVAIDDGDGYTNANETLFGVRVLWRAPVGVRTTGVSLWFTGADNTTPPGCGPFVAAPDGEATASSSCLTRLPDGVYRLHARWEKTDGELTPEAVASSVKDTVVDIPVIVSPAEGARVGTAVVTLRGRAEPGATVTVRTAAAPRTVLGSGVADAGGTWSVAIALDDGDHDISAFAVDVAGNRSASAPPRHFTVDTSVPDTVPPGPPVITSPASGSLVPHRFAVAGTAEPGAGVTVYVGSFAVGVAPVDAGGNWVAFVELPEGVFSLEAVATDRAGNASTRSAPVQVDVDAFVPEVRITTRPDTVFLPGEDVVIEGVATDNREVAAPILVEIYDPRPQKVRDAAAATCTGCGTPSASWRFVPSPRLAPGVYLARVIVRDRAGNQSEAAVRFVVLAP